MALSNSFNIEGRMGVSSLAQVDGTATWALNDCLEFATDNGVVECVYLAAGTGGVVAGNLCTMKSGAATKTATSGDAGKPLCVALTAMSAGQYGWFAVKGTVPVLSGATTVVGNPVYMGGAAGVTTSSATVGKAILNAVFAEAKTYSSTNVSPLTTIQHPVQEAANS